MNRQDAIIKITKINRFAKQLNYWCELNVAINLDVFGDELYEINQWVEDIHEYLRKEPSSVLIGLVEDIGSPQIVSKYLETCANELTEDLQNILNRYVVNMEVLLKDCGLLEKKSKGKYAHLPKELANGKAADLLQRAVKAGFLDKQFQPTAITKPLQLKAIAYAVSQLMRFNSHHTYVYFNRMWKRGGYTLSSVTTPRLSDEGYKVIMDIYPEADFSKFVPKYEGRFFNCPFDKAKRVELYKQLVYQGYIDKSTTKDQFLGIFDKEKFKKPVNWIREQRLLSYFAKMAFGSTNSKHLWVKTYCCFVINGKTPHKDSFLTGYGQLLRSGQIESYDIDLKAIAENYCQGLNKSTAQIAEENI